eukprot:1340996-Rhodomonas_salina.3
MSAATRSIFSVFRSDDGFRSKNTVRQEKSVQKNRAERQQREVAASQNEHQTRTETKLCKIRHAHRFKPCERGFEPERADAKPPRKKNQQRSWGLLPSPENIQREAEREMKAGNGGA